MWIVREDAEVPVACVPVEWTIEVFCCAEATILPIPEDVAQVEVTSCPVCSIAVVHGVYTHEVVEVYLVCCLILLFCQVKLVCHLIGEEQSLLTSLLITHCVC